MYKNMSVRSIKFGFTLIELLVVISIIGILTTLVAANLNSARSRARDAGRKSDLKNIQTALRLYYNDNGRYPETPPPFGAKWEAGSTVYMSKVPQDTLSPDQTFQYTVGATDKDLYTLSACLENGSDKQGVTASGITCPSNWMFQVNQ